MEITENIKPTLKDDNICNRQRKLKSHHKGLVEMVWKYGVCMT
jgi:hypothetical protein